MIKRLLMIMLCILLIPISTYSDLPRADIQSVAEQATTQINNLAEEIETQYETKDSITNNRKLSPTGDFTGTLNGMPISAIDVGLSTSFNAHISQIASETELGHVKVHPENIDSNGFLTFSTSSSDLVLTDGTDCTAEIQNALNKKGLVRISSAVPATYLISDTLLIDSDTILEISDNVTIKLADGISKYMLKNKNQVNGNVNITIRGGTWDGNDPTNPTTGAYPTGFPGHGLFFHKVDNLKYENLNLKNFRKYCSLVVDCENFIARNIGLNNDSDGLHFQPPLKNAYIENIHGHTGDDMLAFTLGDYDTYQVSNTGDFDTVKINHVVCENVDNVVALVGSGNGSVYKYKNFIIDDISGSVVNSTIRCTQDGANLINTFVESIVMKNICTTGGSNASIVFTPVYATDVYMDNVISDQTINTITLGYSGAVYDNITINNVKSKNDVLGNLFTIYGGTTINNLTIDKVKAKLSSSGVFIKFKTPTTIKKVTINNVDIEGGTSGSSIMFELDGVTTEDFSINNAYIKNVTYCFYVKSNLTMRLNNCNFAGTITTPIIVFPNYTLRILGVNNQTAFPMTPTLVDGTAHCIINDSSWIQ